MAIYDTSRPAGDAISTKIATALVGAIYALIEDHYARKTQKALSRLSDEALDDIGLTRPDIARVTGGRC